jgi:hypothetical protein
VVLTVAAVDGVTVEKARSFELPLRFFTAVKNHL